MCRVVLVLHLTVRATLEIRVNSRRAIDHVDHILEVEPLARKRLIHPGDVMSVRSYFVLMARCIFSQGHAFPHHLCATSTGISTAVIPFPIFGRGAPLFGFCAFLSDFCLIMLLKSQLHQKKMHSSSLPCAGTKQTLPD